MLSAMLHKQNKAEGSNEVEWLGCDEERWPLLRPRPHDPLSRTHDEERTHERMARTREEN